MLAVSIGLNLWFADTIAKPILDLSVIPADVAPAVADRAAGLALAIADAMAPCILMVDEIEKYIPPVYNQKSTLTCEVAAGANEHDFHLRNRATSFVQIHMPASPKLVERSPRLYRIGSVLPICGVMFCGRALTDYGFQCRAGSHPITFGKKMFLRRERA